MEAYGFAGTSKSRLTLGWKLSSTHYPDQRSCTTASEGESDFADPYLRMIVDKDSQQYLVINTHKGLYKYKRLPFGVSLAPALFQRAMNSGLKGVVCDQDDIVVTGSTTREHLENLEKVLNKVWTTFAIEQMQIHGRLS